MLQTPLYDWHVAHGGRMVDFAGWAMPVQYSTIIAEHHAVRRAAGLFDISHMGRLWLRGPDAVPLVERLVTCRVATMKPGQVRYGLVTNESGGVLDDVLVYRSSGPGVSLVVNASNRDKIIAWIGERFASDDVELSDETLSTGMIALQGPQAAAILEPHAERATTAVAEPDDPEDAAAIPEPHVERTTDALKYYSYTRAYAFGIPVTISRTGYTGEDGFELIAPADRTAELWERLSDAGRPHGLVPCGLGCRDTLRLEAAMPLYGHELSEEIDPVTAGLSFAVALEKEFVGRDAIARIAERGPERVRVGLRLAGKRIAREGTPLFVGERGAGVVTSGSFSPTLDAIIAMAYVPRDISEPGTNLEADLRGRREGATVVKLPFYRRPAA